jgi:hypothetical protein
MLFVFCVSTCISTGLALWSHLKYKPNSESLFPFVGALAYSQSVPVSFVICVRPSVGIGWAPTGHISVKYDTGDFRENM